MRLLIILAVICFVAAGVFDYGSLHWGESADERVGWAFPCLLAIVLGVVLAVAALGARIASVR